PAQGESLPEASSLAVAGAPPQLLPDSLEAGEHALLDGRGQLHDAALGGVSGTVVAAKSGVVACLVFGGQRFDAVPTLFATADAGALSMAEYAGIVGNGLLRRWCVTFDLAHQR